MSTETATKPQRTVLEKGKKYRLTQEGARLSWQVSCGPSCWKGESKVLPEGSEIVYLGQVMGWGSDNIPVANFSCGDVKGEFWPNNWGSVDVGWLEAVPSE